MSVIARMKCRFVTAFEQSQTVELEALIDNDPASPNYSFSKATPSGTLKLNITNPDAFATFTPGLVYDVTIQPLPEPIQAPIE